MKSDHRVKGGYMIELVHPSVKVIQEKIENKESFLILKMSSIKEVMEHCYLIEKISENNHMASESKQKVGRL